MKIMFLNKIFWILLVCFLSSNLLAEEKIVVYQLLVDEKTPLVGRFVVDTHEIPQLELSQPRSQSFPRKQSKLDLRCIDVDGKGSTVKYGVSIQCSQIEWIVEFKKLTSYDYDASEQKNLFSAKGWWMLTEWDDVPRINGVDAATVCANEISNRSEKTCHKLPGTNSAPLFLVWGNERFKYSINNTRFRVFSDSGFDAGRPRELEAQLKKQFKYLSDLRILDKPNLESIEVVWIGIDEKYEELGGAAGSQAYISNYRIRNEKIDVKQIYRLIWISGHEVFHMLSVKKLPLWISESLAHYFGYKSMAQSGIKIEASPLEIWGGGQESQLHALSGLYSAHEMVTQKNDMSYYSLFYDKGAAFWYELDYLLAQNESNLDDLLYLQTESNSENGRLNVNFSNAVVGAIGESRYEQLIEKYL